MSRPVYIYTLSHPLTEQVRYVGKTYNISKRLEAHIFKAKNFIGSRKIYNWIQELLKDGLRPLITKIEDCYETNWAEREKYWIAYYRNIGLNLCNLTDGGESNNGYVYSEELKEVRRMARLGKPFPKESAKKIANTLSKKVICVEDGIVFNSMKQAISSTHVPRSTFHRKMHKGELINGKTFQWYNSQLKTDNNDK